MQRERFTTEPETRSWNNSIGQNIVIIEEMLKPDLPNLLLLAIRIFFFIYHFFRVVYRKYEILLGYLEHFLDLFLKINPSDNLHNRRGGGHRYM